MQIHRPFSRPATSTTQFFGPTKTHGFCKSRLKYPRVLGSRFSHRWQQLKAHVHRMLVNNAACRQYFPAIYQRAHLWRQRRLLLPSLWTMHPKSHQIQLSSTHRPVCTGCRPKQKTWNKCFRRENPNFPARYQVMLRMWPFSVFRLNLERRKASRGQSLHVLFCET